MSPRSAPNVPKGLLRPREQKAWQSVFTVPTSVTLRSEACLIPGAGSQGTWLCSQKDSQVNKTSVTCAIHRSHDPHFLDANTERFAAVIVCILTAAMRKLLQVYRVLQSSVATWL